MSDLSFSSACDIAQAVKDRRVSAREVTFAALSRIARLDPALGCFLRVDPQGALSQADLVDATIAAGAHLPLAGVPVGLKDILVTRGLETTCASRILAGWIPPYDATVVSRLRQAGAVILGKLNMDEFAMGSSTENSAFHQDRPCRNPWDLQRVPGGSSGGAAAAVAADLCPLTLGTDTGGSIRQPAALCGVTGLKPTYGRVSRSGVIAFASSLDQVGPLARTVEDVALCLQVIGGPDPLDATCSPDPLPPLSAACHASVRGLRVGIPDEYFGETRPALPGDTGGARAESLRIVGLDPQVGACVRAAIESLREDGAELVPISLPLTPYAVAAYYLIATAEASSNLARYDGVRYGLRAADPQQGRRQSLTEMYERTRAAGFGDEVKRRIMLGTFVLRSGYYDAYYRRASQVRTLLQRDFAEAFRHCDVIATPTSPVPAFRLGERTQDPLSMYLADIYTISANLAGLPAISVPCGLVVAADGHGPGRPLLPVGLQLLGPQLGEEQVLRAAAGYQRLSDWHLRRPPALGPQEAAQP